MLREDDGLRRSGRAGRILQQRRSVRHIHAGLIVLSSVCLFQVQPRQPPENLVGGEGGGGFGRADHCDEAGMRGDAAEPLESTIARLEGSRNRDGSGIEASPKGDDEAELSLGVDQNRLACELPIHQLCSESASVNAKPTKVDPIRFLLAVAEEHEGGVIGFLFAPHLDALDE
jgi:hypothetical protein